jgi:hypothetical protein
MRRAALILVALTALAGLALAQGPGPAPSAEERLRRLQRDRGLIEELVEGGLRIAAEDDAVKRAEACGGLADTFAQEVRLAAAAKDGARAADLGRDLQGLLKGLALNLKQAHARLPADSPRAPDLERVGQRVLRAIAPAMEDLGRDADTQPEAVQEALQALTIARGELQKASRGRSQNEKAPPGGGSVGKKNKGTR